MAGVSKHAARIVSIGVRHRRYQLHRRISFVPRFPHGNRWCLSEALGTGSALTYAFGKQGQTSTGSCK